MLASPRITAHARANYGLKLINHEIMQPPRMRAPAWREFSSLCRRPGFGAQYVRSSAPRSRPGYSCLLRGDFLSLAHRDRPPPGHRASFLCAYRPHDVKLASARRRRLVFGEQHMTCDPHTPDAQPEPCNWRTCIATGWPSRVPCQTVSPASTARQMNEVAPRRVPSAAAKAHNTSPRCHRIRRAISSGRDFVAAGQPYRSRVAPRAAQPALHLTGYLPLRSAEHMNRWQPQNRRTTVYLASWRTSRKPREIPPK